MRHMFDGGSKEKARRADTERSTLEKHTRYLEKEASKGKKSTPEGEEFHLQNIDYRFIHVSYFTQFS